MPQIGGTARLRRSTDGGATWVELPVGAPFTSTIAGAAYAPSDPDVLYVNLRGALDTFVYRSDDAGTSFTQLLMTSGGSTSVSHLAVHPTDPDDVIVFVPGTPLPLRSTDGGTTFTPMAGASFSALQLLQWDPDGVLLWAIEEDTTWYSSDSGATWTEASLSPLPTYASSGPFIFDSLGRRLLSSNSSPIGSGDLYRMDAGTPSSWGGLGAVARRVEDVVTGAPGGDRFCSLPFDNLFFGSSNFGARIAAPGESFAPFPPSYDVKAAMGLAIDPSDPTVWLAASGAVFYCYEGCNIRLVTRVYEGSGSTFTVATEAQARTGYGAHWVEYAFDPSMDDGVARLRVIGSSAWPSFSLNGGFSWSEATTPTGSIELRPALQGCLAHDPFTPGRTLVLGEVDETGPTPQIGWVESTDGGQSYGAPLVHWSLSGGNGFLTPSQAAFLVFDPHYADVVYAGDTENGLRQSLDGGATWSLLGVSLSERSELVVHPELPALLCVTDADGELLVSTDFGVSFEPAWADQGAIYAGALAIDASTGGMLVGTERVSVWELPHASPYVSVGDGVAGAGGVVPRHWAHADLPHSGGTLTLAGDRILGGAPVVLHIGLTQVALPLLGGTLYVGRPSVYRQLLVPVGAPGLAGGAYFLESIPIPSNPSLVGVELISQFGVIDAAGPQGFALSNGLRTTILP